jgi:predicted nucleotide-binding protein (sugar kinase/HSP70/actin superfamily)
MKVGVPNALLYARYHVFVKTFLSELGAEIVVSPPTNKAILDMGVSGCVDDACLPVKVFHGHAAWLGNRCDLIFIPRLIGVKEKEYICPMFCGLIEMVKNSLPGLPGLIDAPLTSVKGDAFKRFARGVGKPVTDDRRRILAALEKAGQRYREEKTGFCDRGYPITVALVGHAYNLYDRFINMDLKKKLNRLGIGVVTSEWADREGIELAGRRLFKKPFWTFAREYFGAAVSLAEAGLVQGIVYVSSFSCGIDSVVSELIQSEVGDFPLLVVKLDEHTGEAGLDTRLEAFADMLKRRCERGYHLSQYGECRRRGGSAVSGTKNSLCPAGKKQ